MVKKRQVTTGQPKVKPKSTPDAAKTEFRSRAEREAQIQRWVLWGTGISVGVIAIIIIVALIISQVINPRQVVATINGENISVADFQKRVRLERALHNNQITNVYNYLNAVGYPEDQISQLITQQDPYKTYYNEMLQPDQMGIRVLNDMLTERFIRAKAKELGVSVSEADIQKEIDQAIGANRDQIEELRASEVTPEATLESTAEATAEVTVEPTATQTPTPVYVSPTPTPPPTLTPTPAATATSSPTPVATIPPGSPTATQSAADLEKQFTDAQSGFFTYLRRSANVGDDDIKAYYENLALRKVVRDAVTKDVAKKTMFVNVRHILVGTEEEARDILDALKAGESFADLARAASKDAGNPQQGQFGSAQAGGELGWAAAFNYVKPFADASLTLPIGQFSDPIKTDFGYHIIQVRAREEREAEDSQVESAKDSAFKTWLDTAKTSPDYKSETFNWVNFVPSDPPFGLIQ